VHNVQTLDPWTDEQSEYREYLHHHNHPTDRPDDSKLDRVCADISQLLNDQGHTKDAELMAACRPGKRCSSAYCLKCIRSRAIRTRKHVHKTLPALLDNDLNLELWFITGCCADSDDVKTHARSAVRGMKKLLKHPRLRNRIVGVFGAMEIAPKTSRLPCAHVHSLIVCKPISKGKYRISEADWVRMWEESCDAPRLNPHLKMIRRNAARKKPNLSLVALQILRNQLDISGTIDYCTKGSDHDQVMLNQLKGTTRFFGDLAN
jgi:Replication protein